MKIRATAAAFALASAPFAFAVPAFAGSLDEPVAQPTPVIATAPAAYTSLFSGGYAGAQVGYGWADRSGQGDPDTFSDRIDNTTNAIENIGSDGDGWLGGVHGGYLWNADRFVYGLEGDYDFSDIELDNNVGSVDRIGRIKAKAGYDLGQTLIYATAGAAYAEADVFGRDFNDWGWVAGAGVDYMLSDTLSVGAEALYHEFDEFDDSGTDLSLATVTAKVSYRF